MIQEDLIPALILLRCWRKLEARGEGEGEREREREGEGGVKGHKDIKMLLRVKNDVHKR